MPTSKSKRKQRRVPGQSKERRKSEHDSQQSLSEHTGRPDRLQKANDAQCEKGIYSLSCTGGFNTTGLRFETKLGYNILAQYGVRPDFSLDEKIRAYMMYTCVRHIPGFVDKQFDNINDAICYVHGQTHALIEGDWGFISQSQDSYRTLRKIPNDYLMQITYDTFGYHGRWQSYCGLTTIKNKALRKAAVMCVHAVIHEFNFALFDYEEQEGCMSFEHWKEWKNDCSDEMEEFYETFASNHDRAFDPKIDEGTPAYTEWNTIQVNEQLYQEECDRYETLVDPLAKHIHAMKPDNKYIIKQAKKHAGEPIAIWLNHIVMLREQNFKINHYIADSYRDTESYDEESMNPLSAFGYIFDGDSVYAEDCNSQFNDRANNVGVIPFAINEVIHPVKGLIYKTPEVPLGDWINKIFLFNLTDLCYEIE